jgi:hypothetical protein
VKDLFVLTADSDMEAVLRAVLARHRNLRIHPISFEVRRFTGRDSGMVKEGPEIARVMVNKSLFSKLILMWDHHGSGKELRSADEAIAGIQVRLDGVTWAKRSAAVAIVPELEEWLWHSPRAIARHLGLNDEEFDGHAEHAATLLERAREQCCRELPKELFQAVLYRVKRRGPLPEDFKALGASANLSEWSASGSFHSFVQTLRTWFPLKAL